MMKHHSFASLYARALQRARGYAANPRRWQVRSGSRGARSMPEFAPRNTAPAAETAVNLSTDAQPSPLLESSRQFYNGLWSDAQVVEPERFNTWPLVSSLVAQHPRRLEVAPGLRPRLPIADTHFVDISAPAL